MNGLTALITMGFSPELVQQVNKLPIESENQAEFLKNAKSGYVWQDIDDLDNAYFKIRLLTLRVFYKGAPLYGVYGTDVDYKRRPYYISVRLRAESNISETVKRVISDQFPEGKFSVFNRWLYQERAVFYGVLVVKEVIKIDLESETDMGFPLTGAFS